MNPDREAQNNGERSSAESAPGISSENLAGVPVESQLEQVWNRVRNYGFSVGGWNFLLQQGLYSELLIAPEIAPLPGSPSHFLGLTNVRGNLVPVYRLETWLNRSVPEQATSPRYALIIDAVDKGVALVVGDKPRSVNLRDFHEQTLAHDIPSTLGAVVAASYKQGHLASAKADGETWHLLNHQYLFDVLSVNGPIP